MHGDDVDSRLKMDGGREGGWVEEKQREETYFGNELNPLIGLLTTMRLFKSRKTKLTRMKSDSDEKKSREPTPKVVPFDSNEYDEETCAKPRRGNIERSCNGIWQRRKEEAVYFCFFCRKIRENNSTLLKTRQLATNDSNGNDRLAELLSLGKFEHLRCTCIGRESSYHMVLFQSEICPPMNTSHKQKLDSQNCKIVSIHFDHLLGPPFALPRPPVTTQRSSR